MRTCLAGSTIDLTEQRRAEEQIRRLRIHDSGSSPDNIVTNDTVCRVSGMDSPGHQFLHHRTSVRYLR